MRSEKHCESCTCGRRAVVQASSKSAPGTISWAEHLEAWNGYAREYGSQQSPERINQRGGFGYDELESFLGRKPSTFVPGRGE